MTSQQRWDDVLAEGASGANDRVSLLHSSLPLLNATKVPTHREGSF